MRCQRLANSHPGDGSSGRRFGSPSKGRHEGNSAVAAQGHDGAHPVRPQCELQLVRSIDVEERRDVEFLAGYCDSVLVRMHDVCMPLAVRVMHLGDDGGKLPAAVIAPEDGQRIEDMAQHTSVSEHQDPTAITEPDAVHRQEVLDIRLDREAGIAEVIPAAE
jgi:hypothetical protein